MNWNNRVAAYQDIGGYDDDDDGDNDDDDDDDDGDDDDKDAFICKSVNFKVRTSKFCMEIDLDNI